MTIILLTGTPGVGKTTVVMDVAKELKERGMKVDGIVSREVRTNNDNRRCKEFTQDRQEGDCGYAPKTGTSFN